MLRLLRLVSLPYLRASWGGTLLVVGGIATGVSLVVARGAVERTGACRNKRATPHKRRRRQRRRSAFFSNLLCAESEICRSSSGTYGGMMVPWTR